jgi:hypothetical protein
MVAVALATLLLAAQVAPQGATGALIGVNALVEGFVADCGLPMGLQEASDLLGTPLQGELLLREGPGVLCQARGVGTGLHADVRELLSLLWPVATFASVAGKLSTDCRFATLDEHCDLALIVSGLLEDVNLIAFVSGEMCVVHSRQL